MYGRYWHFQASNAFHFLLLSMILRLHTNLFLLVRRRRALLGPRRQLPGGPESRRMRTLFLRAEDVMRIRNIHRRDIAQSILIAMAQIGFIARKFLNGSSHLYFHQPIYFYFDI